VLYIAVLTPQQGMKEKGKRRIIVPASLGYIAGAKDGLPGPIPVGYSAQRQITTRKNEPFFFEVEVTRIREPPAGYKKK
jgi:FKBP-type peptidyl-prolyl cis-trans isomerase